MKEEMQPIWNNLAKISKDDAKNIALDGNEKARKVAKQTMQEVKDAMHLRW